MQKTKCTAIVLAAGQGKRMGTKVQKQYLEISGKPVLFYSLDVFQKSDMIDDIILVVGENQEEYCREEIIEKFHITKVRKIVKGGAERYHSVWNGLQEIAEDGYVFIHDGARPFVTEEILSRVYDAVQTEKACVVGMPVKDTIKIVDDDAYVSDTPERKYVWQVQTPQCFAFPLIYDAYSTIIQDEEEGWTLPVITDDAMVLEYATDHEVKMIEADYKNIKITTPEDLYIAELFLKNK